MVWGYQGAVKRRKGNKCRYSRSAPGPTFEVLRDVPANVQWVNDVTQPSFLPVDPTLHWANPNNKPPLIPPFPKFPPGFPTAQFPVPLVTHLHGGEVRSDSDGGPGSWFTPGEEIKGPEFLRSLYHYPNQQAPTTLWYHDHTLGTTRLNVYAGLAGFYIIRDPQNPIEHLLPKEEYEIPMVIQDRSFNEDGTLAFPNKGDNPNIHSYWQSSFSGNSIMVNGKVWPNLNVKRRQYRFRLLNGSNTRTYNLSMPVGRFFKLCFLQIGSDGGFLPRAVKMSKLLLAPGERADVLIDFSELDPGTQIIMRNDANLPFPNGCPPNPETVGQIMQFTVMDTCPEPPVKLPPRLNKIPKFRPNVPKKIRRQLCRNVAVYKKTSLDPPALLSQPIEHTNEISAHINEVKTELVTVRGVVKRKVSYTALVKYGERESYVIEDEIPFNCKIDDDDAKEGDQFNVAAAQMLYEVYSRAECCASNCITQEQVACQYTAKDMIQVCVQKGDY